MSATRRRYDQPARDDYVVFERLGVATVRTDHADGSATYAVLAAEPDYPGLHLATSLRVDAAAGVFTLRSPAGTSTHVDLVTALGAAARLVHVTPGACAA